MKSFYISIKEKGVRWGAFLIIAYFLPFGFVFVATTAVFFVEAGAAFFVVAFVAILVMCM
jgi:hypothetical protein